MKKWRKKMVLQDHEDTANYLADLTDKADLIVKMLADSDATMRLDKIDTKLNALFTAVQNTGAVQVQSRQPPQATHLDLPISPSREMLHALRSFIRIATKANAHERESLLGVLALDAGTADAEEEALCQFGAGAAAAFKLIPLPVE